LTKTKVSVKFERLRNYKIQSQNITIIFAKDYLEKETEIFPEEVGNQLRNLPTEEDCGRFPVKAQTIAIGGSWLQRFNNLPYRHCSPIHVKRWPFRLLS
jgi:hypothetical protein